MANNQILNSAPKREEKARALSASLGSLTAEVNSVLDEFKTLVDSLGAFRSHGSMEPVPEGDAPGPYLNAEDSDVSAAIIHEANRLAVFRRKIAEIHESLVL